MGKWNLLLSVVNKKKCNVIYRKLDAFINFYNFKQIYFNTIAAITPTVFFHDILMLRVILNSVCFAWSFTAVPIH